MKTRLFLMMAFFLFSGMAAMAEEKPKPVVAKCAGITKTGARCKRTVKPPAVYCYQHLAQTDKKAKRFDIPGCTTDSDCEKKYGPAYRE